MATKHELALQQIVEELEFNLTLEEQKTDKVLSICYQALTPADVITPEYMYVATPKLSDDYRGRE